MENDTDGIETVEDGESFERWMDNQKYQEEEQKKRQRRQWRREQFKR